jgi:UrcA family protein
MKRILTGLFCLGAALIVSGAQGGGLAPLPDDGREVRSLTVGFADLDLANAAGAETLYDRLRTAARRVCGKADPRDVGAVKDMKRCRSEALDAAVAGVNHPRLTALHVKSAVPGELVGINLRPIAQH